MKFSSGVLPITIITVLLCNCKKESVTSNKLIGFSDSSYHYVVVYKDKMISEIYVDSLNRKPVLPMDRVIYEYKTNYVKATFAYPQFYVEYFLNDLKLPTQIITHYQFSGAETLRTMKFYYNSNAQLDSMVRIGLDGRNKFIPEYTNGNITKNLKVQQTATYPSDTVVFKFTYTSVANVFRATDPYLFIYNDATIADETFLLPRLFSAGTIQSTTLKLNRGVFETKNFSYTLNANGKLTFENYGDGVYPYQRIYQY